MIKRIILISLISGFIGGILLTGLQFIKTVPLIHQAEIYEGNDLIIYSKSHTNINAPIKATMDHEMNENVWSPKDGFQRTSFTFISNIVLAIGFSFILCAVYLFVNNIDTKKAIIVGVVSYLTFFALPSLGLHPELPGTVAASLNDRQTWWIATVIASALGFSLLFFNKNTIIRFAGVLIIAIPHIIKAPLPNIHAGTAPYTMLQEFEYTSFITNAVFWILLSIITFLFFKKQNIQFNN